jgi:hypothetical protein
MMFLWFNIFNVFASRSISWIELADLTNSHNRGLITLKETYFANLDRCTSMRPLGQFLCASLCTRARNLPHPRVPHAHTDQPPNEGQSHAPCSHSTKCRHFSDIQHRHHATGCPEGSISCLLAFSCTSIIAWWYRTIDLQFWGPHRSHLSFLEILSRPHSFLCLTKSEKISIREKTRLQKIMMFQYAPTLSSPCTSIL